MDSLSLAQVLAAYNVSLAQVFTHKTCVRRGTLEPKHDTVYGGTVDWYVTDGDARLTVRMPERWQVYRGRRVKVTGQLTPRLWIHRGVIEVVLDVEHMNPLEPPPDDWIGPLRRIGEKRRSSWPAIERSLERRLLAGKRPCVLMLLGNSSIVDKDVFAALGGHARAYHLTPQRIQLTTPATVAADAVCPQGRR